jgi:UDP-N-acetylglucosamine--N-acetylmuramyl-(pentapeptide) pyrophosphoryl-undecaprenol N-acetylglucosamine transferase
MTIAIAAAGTGGHVFPALAVAEQLGDTEVVFFGGDRFEATAVPAAGHDFVQVEVAGLQRSLTPRNLALPFVVRRATAAIADEMRRRDVSVLLATGGYVTVPAALAARRLGIPFFLAEQNAHAGLANRLMGRWAEATFTAFPTTEGARKPRHVGNPVRAAIGGADLAARRPEARRRYGLDPDVPVVGVVGGSLGSRPINEAVAAAMRGWDGPPVAVLQLAGERFIDEARAALDGIDVPWVVVGFEEHMEDFFAAVDVVVSRASGMVAELTATGTPAVLVPGEYGSKGHQAASAAALTEAGAAIVVPEADLSTGLGPVLVALVGDPDRRTAMHEAARAIGRPDAAAVIAGELLDAAA